MNRDDIEYGITIPGVYDGVSVWVLKDGTIVNRWRRFRDSGERGLRRRYQLTEAYISDMGSE